MGTVPQGALERARRRKAAEARRRSLIVTDEMVDRACTVLTDDDWFDGTFPESAMRRALEAALKLQADQSSGKSTP